jgi:hypothetical protein
VFRIRLTSHSSHSNSSPSSRNHSNRITCVRNRIQMRLEIEELTGNHCFPLFRRKSVRLFHWWFTWMTRNNLCSDWEGLEVDSRVRSWSSRMDCVLSSRWGVRIQWLQTAILVFGETRHCREIEPAQSISHLGLVFNHNHRESSGVHIVRFGLWFQMSLAESRIVSYRIISSHRQDVHQVSASTSKEAKQKADIRNGALTGLHKQIDR